MIALHPTEIQSLMSRGLISVVTDARAVEKWRTPERNQEYYFRKTRANPERYKQQARIRKLRWLAKRKAVNENHD